MLRLALHLTVPHADRPRDQRRRPRRDVRLVPLQHSGLLLAAALEAGHHGAPDRPVRLQLSENVKFTVRY